MPRNLEKLYDYIQGDIKNDRDLGNFSPNKVDEKLSIVTLESS